MPPDSVDCCYLAQMSPTINQGKKKKFQTFVIQKNQKFCQNYHLPSLKIKGRRKEGAERGCVQIWLIVATWHISPQQSTKNRKFRHQCHLPSLQVKRRKREGAERGKVRNKGECHLAKVKALNARTLPTINQKAEDYIQSGCVRKTRGNRNTRSVEKRCCYSVVTFSYL